MEILVGVNIVFYNLILSRAFSNSNWNYFGIVLKFCKKLLKNKYNLYIHNADL